MSVPSHAPPCTGVHARETLINWLALRCCWRSASVWSPADAGSIRDERAGSLLLKSAPRTPRRSGAAPADAHARHGDRQRRAR